MERSVRVRLRAEIDDYRRQMEAAARATDKIPESAGRAETALGRMVQSARYNREAWDRAGTTMVAFGTATLTGLAVSARAAVNWESAWAGVLKTVDGSSTQLNALENDLREMARTLPATHEEIAAVAEAAGALGVATEDVSSFTRVMIDLGETTNLTADEAATAIAQLMNVMQTAPEDVDNLASTLVALGNNGASTERQILDMAQRIAAAGQVAGLSETDVLGLANALASVGIEAEAGGSAISRVISEIAQDVATGGDDLRAWADVAGMTADEFAAAWEADPARALAAFTSGLGDMQAAGENVFGVLEDLGMSDVRVRNALLTMATAGDLLTESLDMSARAWDENMALLLEAQKRYDTTAARLDIAKNSIHDSAIELGETFLPAIADAADGVADFAAWVAELPDPVKNAAGAIAGVTGGLGLLGGAFLLLFPRITETVTAFRNLGTSAQNAIKGVGATAAIVTVTAALISLADAAQTASLSSEELLNRLVAIESQGAEVSTALDDIGQGWADKLAVGGEIDVTNVEEFRGALEDLQDFRPAGFISDFTNMLQDIAGQDGGLRQLNSRLHDLGGELGTLAQQDLPRATALFNQFVEAAGGGEDAVAMLLNVMPGYEEALYSVANAQGLALDETSLLKAATGELSLGQTSATESAEDLAAATQYVGQTTEEATAALDEWRSMVKDADAAFVDSQGAYQAVIDAKIAAAQAFAESTVEDVGVVADSWEDYYDGVTVSASEYIAELQAQVDAQSAWEQNILDITARVRDGMTGDMRTAAEQMIDELLNLGPEGAAQVQLLHDMSDEEFAQVVALWSQKGTEAVEEFTTQVESYRQPVIEITADLSSAYAQVDAFVRAANGMLISVNANGQQVGFRTGPGAQAGLADGGEVPGSFIGPRSDNVLIRATPREYMQPVVAHDFWGTGFMDAVRRRDVGAVVSSLPGFADGGPIGLAPTVFAAGTGGSSLSLAGLSIEGVLDLGNGLVGTLRGVVREEISTAQKSRTSAMVQGVR